MTDKPIYLDYAAATPLDDRVLQAMQPYLSENFYNPSATYRAAQSVAQELQSSRSSIAHWLGARPSEIIFTAGGTEANNLAVQGIMQSQPQGNVIVSAVEHESVLAPAALYDHKITPVDNDGLVTISDLQPLIDDNTVLISIMYANNEVGSIQPLNEIARLINQVRNQRRRNGIKTPLYFHTDAAQAANYLDLHAARLGVDLMTLNGGKIYGPKQSGILFVQSSVKLQPMILGGGQERGMRSGTENVAAVVGLSKALEITHGLRHEESKRLQSLQAYFFDLLEKQLPMARLNGSKKKRLPNNVHLSIPGIDNERLLIQLDESGVLAAAGSACSASDEEPSHVLKAMGRTDDEARSSIRMTMGRSTDKSNIDRTVSLLVRFSN